VLLGCLLAAHLVGGQDQGLFTNVTLDRSITSIS